MNSVTEETGTISVALEHAARLLKSEPRLAAEQAQEILKVAPNHPQAIVLLASAYRRSVNPQAAMELLDPLIRAQPQWASAHFERALTLAASGRGDDAIEALRRTVQLKPDHTEAWRVLADHLMAIGDTQGGDEAYANHIRSSTRDPGMLKAAGAMAKNDIATAERLLKAHLKEAPTDVAAIRMLAEVAVRCGREPEAERLIERCLELAPGFTAARYNYAVLLHRANDPHSALAQIEQCLAAEPDNPSYRNLCAVILSRIGEYKRSSSIYARLLSEYPDNAKVWLSYGHVLKTEARQDECIDAYRKCIERRPAFGEAYWSLANLKTFRFSSSDIEEMTAQLNDAGLGDEDAWHLHFALGKAYEDAETYTQSFKHYAQGNALYRAANAYDADKNATRAERLKEYFSHRFFKERESMGCDAADAIFIVGMPRSGSTLLEQILSCHSTVEGTTELPEMIRIAQELRDEAGSDELAAHVSVLASKSPAELRALGEKYMQRTRIYRKTDKPFFIDKMPNNFLHIGIIQLILPNARIIDARRHPLGCCLSNFKQYYARGQNFSYDLEDMGRFYVDYVDLMAHFDAVLPGRIHRVFYEDTVADTEAVIRRLLDYCGLEFEAECLRFFESRRPVRTASSEQVRQPIYSSGVEQWRNFEPWLEPLRRALGPVLEMYPDVPPL